MQVPRAFVVNQDGCPWARAGESARLGRQGGLLRLQPWPNMPPQPLGEEGLLGVKPRGNVWVPLEVDGASFLNSDSYPFRFLLC